MSGEIIKEKWFVKHWRPAAAWIYLGICVFDFVAMPLYHMQSQGSLNRIVEISMQLRPEDRLSAIVQLSRKTTWEPITLGDGSFFHLSFGAILGVAAWTRGRVQEQMVRNQPRNRRRDDDYSDENSDYRVHVPGKAPDDLDAVVPRTQAAQQPQPRPPRRSAPIDMSSY